MTIPTFHLTYLNEETNHDLPLASKNSEGKQLNLESFVLALLVHRLLGATLAKWLVSMPIACSEWGAIPYRSDALGFDTRAQTWACSGPIVHSME